MNITEKKPSWMEVSNVMPGTQLVINKLWLELNFSAVIAVCSQTWKNKYMKESTAT